MTDKQLFANNATTTLNGAINNTVTTITVDDASVFPAPLAVVGSKQSEFTLVTISYEVLKVTAISGNDLTVVRGYEGTTAGSHGDGVDVDGRATEDTFHSFVAVDNDGDRKGSDSVNIQPLRAVSTQVASGASAIAIGAYTGATSNSAIAIGTAATAANTGVVAIGGGASSACAGTVVVGSSAVASDLSAETGWTATTEAGLGEVWEISTDWGYAVVGFVNTGGTEPTGFSVGDYVTDGSVTWYIFETVGANTGNTALGATVDIRGGYSVGIGTDITSYGSSNVTIGSGLVTVGQLNTCVGSDTTVIGRGNVALGAHSRDYTIIDREVTNATVVGDSPHMAVSETCRLVGPDYLPIETDDMPKYSDGVTAASSYRGMSAKEQTFFSPPICAGVSVWVASTTYKHGETVTKTGAASDYSYFALIPDTSTGYYGTATSGGAEPAWPTTAGVTVADGSITWVCVDRTDIRHYLPDNSRLIPTEVGFIGDEFTATSGTQPTISFGIVGTLAKWKAAAITTLITGPYSRESLTTLINTEGSKTLGADITAFGTTQMSGRVYWKGIVVETLEA